MKIYWEVLKPYKKYLILSPILVIGFVFCETAQPTLMAYIIDEGVMKKDLTTVTNIGLIMVALSAVAIGLSLSNLYCASKTAVGFSTGLRKKMFHKIQQFSFSDIDKFNTASLITRMTNDTTMLQQILQRSMMLLYRAPLMMVFAFIFVVRINVLIACIIAGALPVLAVSIFLLLRKGFPLFIKVQQKLDKLNDVVRENLINIRVIKSFVREDFEKEKFNRSNEDLRDISVKAFNIVITAMPVMQLVVNILIICILWIGSVKGLQVGAIISLVNYTMQILMALMLVSMTVMMFARASASSQRILEVLHKEPTIMDTPKATSAKHKITKGDIVFNNVCFKYNNESENYVLKNINFQIPVGQHVALIGATGSAKSTLLQLIPRLYDITEGEILIDGINIKDYPLSELRNNIGVVLQKNELFSGTILSNLKWGDSLATFEEIVEAAKAAEAHDFIMSFPQQYETILGQGGVNISGGQKQRLCIARALLKKPKILILDNSTSAVDTETERKIRKNLYELLHNTTLLTVTQRYSTMQASDRIIILEDGEIDAMGTSSELLKTSKIYQEIYNSQQLVFV
jgi:ATP-binding cassette subfamily B protein